MTTQYLNISVTWLLHHFLLHFHQVGSSILADTLWDDWPKAIVEFSTLSHLFVFVASLSLQGCVDKLDESLRETKTCVTFLLTCVEAVAGWRYSLGLTATVVAILLCCSEKSQEERGRSHQRSTALEHVPAKHIWEPTNDTNHWKTWKCVRYKDKAGCGTILNLSSS